MWVCNLRVKASSLFCVQCGTLVLGKCAGVKMVTQQISCRKCEGNIGEAVEQEVTLCDEVETVS